MSNENWNLGCNYGGCHRNLTVLKGMGRDGPGKMENAIPELTENGMAPNQMDAPHVRLWREAAVQRPQSERPL